MSRPNQHCISWRLNADLDYQDHVFVRDSIEAAYVVARLVRSSEQEPEFWARIIQKNEARRYLTDRNVECVHQLSLTDMLEFLDEFCTHPMHCDIVVDEL